MRGSADEPVEWGAGPRVSDRVVDAVARFVARPFVDRRRPTGRVSWGLAAAVLAVAATGLALRVANNLPGAMLPELGAAHRWFVAVGPSAVVALSGLVGAAREEAAPRVGLVFAGVFGLIGLYAPAASLPAVVAVAAGTGLVIVDRVSGAGWSRPTAVGAVVWVGLALSLASATGLLGVRPVGSTVALLGVALLPLAIRPARWAWIAGLAAAAAVLWVGSVSPFVTGAVVLVAFGVVGAPMLAVAAAAGGGVAGLAGAVVGAHDEALPGRWPAAIAAGLLLVAGVPATLPRALVAGVGVALLVGGDPR